MSHSPCLTSNPCSAARPFTRQRMLTFHRPCTRRFETSSPHLHVMLAGTMVSRHAAQYLDTPQEDSTIPNRFHALTTLFTGQTETAHTYTYRLYPASVKFYSNLTPRLNNSQIRTHLLSFPLFFISTSIMSTTEAPETLCYRQAYIRKKNGRITEKQYFHYLFQHLSGTEHQGDDEVRMELQTLDPLTGSINQWIVHSLIDDGPVEGTFPDAVRAFI